jgi:hypothetical protein
MKHEMKKLGRKWAMEMDLRHLLLALPLEWPLDLHRTVQHVNKISMDTHFGLRDNGTCS